MTAHSHEVFKNAAGRDGSGSGALRRGLYRDGFKRVFDTTLILLSVPFVLPLIVALALLVGRHPFYIQERVGRRGRTYRMWKLRTMVIDADKHLEAHLQANPQARAEWDRTQKLRQDPRITPLGRFLRKSSLDELPQLWNVLRGEMSLVGPRPMMPNQVKLYPGTAYYNLRPGLTGPWQVSARNASTFAERAAYDTAYNKRLSLFGDIQLLVATMRVVLRATGC
ncbi:sugar transferase [Jannaschia sp. AI_61]|uniref:sugar transferase n=1 Tax=Jannaschia sp. AI_61 TaxID=2829796 RepID=UPI001BC687EE|nr:sugar transferase [Jannaschia sp. AI_61]GIT93292.1 sugar transferase [Jannaschia sp. AI_61]